MRLVRRSRSLAEPIVRAAMRTRRAVLGLAVLVPLALAPAMAGADEVLDQFQDWTAHTFTQDGQKVCSMFSKPVKDEGDYTRRGAIWAFVVHRPTMNRSNVVSFEMGYPIKPDSTVSVEIGDRKFQLYTNGEGAFAWPEDDPKLVRAMRAGLDMVVRGISSRGTRTTDTYSLRGFTNAHNAINRACQVN